MGYLENITSNRKLAKRVADSLAIRLFLGFDLDEMTPHHSTISDTERLLPAEIHQRVFDQVLAIAVASGLVSGDHISIDSTLVKANASLNHIERKTPALSVPAYIQRSREENCPDESPPKGGPPDGQSLVSRLIGTAPKGLTRRQLSNQQFHSRTDPDSPDSVGTKKEAMPAGLYYEANVAVDLARRVVTNVALTRGAQEDIDMLLPLLDGALEKYEKFGLSLGSLAVDANYASGRNLMEVARRGIEYYGPHKVEYDKKVYSLSRFEYNPEGDYYTCPQGKRLTFRGTTRHLGKGQRVYQARASDCTGCPAKEKCTASKRRQLFVSQYQPYEELLSQRMKRPRAKRYMRKRRAGAEGVFAECKEHHCLRRTRYRGHPKVYKEILMIFATYNLKRLFKFIKERSCPAWAKGHKLLARLQYLYAFFKHHPCRSSLVTAYE